MIVCFGLFEESRLGFCRVYRRDTKLGLCSTGFHCQALGRSSLSHAHKRGNPTQDATRPWGHTPSGLYKGCRISYTRGHRWVNGEVWLGPPYGEVPSVLDGVEGGAEALEASKNGRSYLAIHAGRGSERLVPTYGCIRLRDFDMKRLSGEFDGFDLFDVVIMREKNCDNDGEKLIKGTEAKLKQLYDEGIL